MVRGAIKSIKPNNSWMVLKNLERFQPLFELTTFKSNEVSDEVIGVFKAFLEQNKVEIIDSNIASVEEVFERYFNDQYPFQEGEKKNEFPDGFILNTVEKWCEQNRRKAFLLSGDTGILRYESKMVIPIGDIAILLDKINRVAIHSKRLEKVVLLYNKNFEDISSDILNNIQQPLEEHLKESFYNANFDIEEVKLSSIDEISIIDYSITHVGENDAQIEIRGTAPIKYTISYIDRRFAFYDKEDDVWYGEEYETEHGSKTVAFKATLKIDHNPIAGEEFADYSGVESIYFDEPIAF
jgi:hypothetical protein